MGAAVEGEIAQAHVAHQMQATADLLEGFLGDERNAVERLAPIGRAHDHADMESVAGPVDAAVREQVGRQAARILRVALAADVEAREVERGWPKEPHRTVLGVTLPTPCRFLLLPTATAAPCRYYYLLLPIH